MEELRTPFSVTANTQLPILTQNSLSQLEIWGYGFLFVSIINLSSIMGILIFPCMKKFYYKILMRIMIGLAIGSLSGSALFHLIPQAFGLKKFDPEGNYLNVAGFLWLAAWAVMIIEWSIKIVVKAKREDQDVENSISTAKHLHVGDETLHDLLKPNNEIPLQLKNGDVHHNSKLSLSQNIKKTEKAPIKSVAWIIIIGDSFHNFVDGIAIGAAFNHGFAEGTTICFAMMMEEFPHELGDFAILVNSGMSVKRAILFNFFSACTCYLGLALGIVMAGEVNGEIYIFAFAAGIFLYVALGDMVPEVSHLIEEMSNKSARKAWTVMLHHNVGILIGISTLYVLAYYG